MGVIGICSSVVVGQPSGTDRLAKGVFFWFKVYDIRERNFNMGHVPYILLKINPPGETAVDVQSHHHITMRLHNRLLIHRCWGLQSKADDDAYMYRLRACSFFFFKFVMTAGVYGPHVLRTLVLRSCA